LPLKESGHPNRFRRVASQALHSVWPIAVIWTLVASHLDVSLDGGVLVADQGAGAVAEGNPALLLPPVAVVLPSPRLARVAATRPAGQYLVDLGINLSEDPLGDARAVIERPAPDDRVEGGETLEDWE
jgi:hypothetical protein